MAKAKVDIVKVINGPDYTPTVHHAVEQEGTGALLFECDTQEEAIEWAEEQNYDYSIHRERNRKPTDNHGQYRKK